MARQQVEFQGLPSRICWLGYGERAKFGRIINEMVANGELSAPIVIGRDHLDCGSVASPNRETEAMKDGSDAVADWPILNALINSVNGASWYLFTTVVALVWVIHFMREWLSLQMEQKQQQNVLSAY